MPIHQKPGSTVVLLSGGLDSAVLLADEAARSGRGELFPVYVSVGLAWERFERQAVQTLLASDALRGRLRPLAALSVDMRDVYPAHHWALEGRPPSYHTADEEVYLPGRNVVLLGKAGVYAAAVGAGRIVLGTLGHNPFPDATRAFRDAMSAALSLGLSHPLEIDAPYERSAKADIVRRGAALSVALAATLSCMNPAEGPRHCGVCSKCRERHEAFEEAGVDDETEYVDRTYVDG